MLSLLVAMTADRVIGRGGGLPWRLSADLRRFRLLTTGHTIVMGRKTFESIGRALLDRRTIVVTRQADFAPPGVEVTNSVDEALRMAAQSHDAEAFIVGGAEIYRQTLDRADRLYVTLVDAPVTGDIWFPTFDWNHWRLVDREDHSADEKNEHPFSFMRYERVPSPTPNPRPPTPDHGGSS